MCGISSERPVFNFCSLTTVLFLQFSDTFTCLQVLNHIYLSLKLKDITVEVRAGGDMGSFWPVSLKGQKRVVHLLQFEGVTC